MQSVECWIKKNKPGGLEGKLYVYKQEGTSGVFKIELLLRRKDPGK